MATNLRRRNVLRRAVFFILEVGYQKLQCLWQGYAGYACVGTLCRLRYFVHYFYAMKYVLLKMSGSVLCNSSSPV